MHTASVSKKIAGAIVAIAHCTSSTGAIAATARMPAPDSISPLVALSALGSDASRAALCGASAAAAAGAAAMAQGAAQGCVLPVLDAAPPPVTDVPPVADVMPPPPVAPPPMPPIEGAGLGFSPLLIGLVGIAAAGLLYLVLNKKDKDDDDNVSPT